MLSSFEISRLGFGAWSIGGAGWAYTGSADRDAASIAAMLHAFELGVNWVDTAPIYGNGHSEELVGQALKLVRGKRPLVFTKCGRRWDGPDLSPRSDLRPDAIRADCEASLQRLGVDVIDLLQFHWPDKDTGVPVEESWGELLRLVEEGKVRAAGVCNFDEQLLERCEAVGHVDSLQTPMSLIARDSAGRLAQWSAAHRTAVIVYSPMQVGLLTDSFSAGQVARFEADDWRRSHPEFQSPKLERNLSLRDALRPIAEAHSTTVAALAVAWTLAWPQVTGAIVGARTAEQVDGWIDGATITLSEGDLDAIAAALVATMAGRGPLSP
ncbi:MAG TPA: aldo/keto reductase [Candidatus Dormibacteraeota bacterium]|nr:aldo/keto reductase [Candidatus Dormibacteraeota bacterium]